MIFVGWLTERRILSDIAILNLLVFITYRLFKHNMNAKRLSIVTFRNVIENSRFGDELKYACFTTCIDTFSRHVTDQTIHC